MQILNSQKVIFNHMKKRALAFEDSNLKNIAQYRKNYLKFSNRPFTSTTLTVLNKALLNSNFIFVADFHTFDHCLKNLIRILKLLISKNKKIVLALEMLSSKDFLLLESFLSGHLTELEFLESINLGNSWKFPWTHYRSIYEFVKLHPQIEIIGVNTNGNLNKRDNFSAELLANRWLENTDKTFVVLYGEYHLAANKIPKKVNDLLDSKPKITTIHQNLDAPYWKILKNKNTIQQQMVIKYNSQEFCLLTSPPWMKYESMCYWYENLYDDPEFDLHQFIIENGLKLLSSNTIDNFELLCRQICTLFKIPYNHDDVSFTLYDFTKISYLQKFVKSKYKNPKAQRFLNLLFETQHMLILPDTNKIYCASYSSNKLAKLAGGLLYLELLNTKNISLLNLYEKFNKFKLFSHFILYHFNSYFMAKSINPYLKCDLFGDHLQLAAKLPSPSSSQLLVKLFNDPSKCDLIVSALKPIELYHLAKISGELIAEMHFLNFQQHRKIFNPANWEKNYLLKPIELASAIELVSEVKKMSGFKNQKKRYY